MKYFVSSDIHSFFDEWMSALARSGFDINNPEHIIIVCGDLLDRGPQTVECFNFMLDMIKQNRAIYIRGNHEDLLRSCAFDLIGHRYIGGHHVSNGTIKSLSAFLDCPEGDLLCYLYNEDSVHNKLISIVNDISQNTVDYYELGDTIFVHGWVPTHADLTIPENWRHSDWDEARWTNGMEAFQLGANIANKTIVCGHWHASYGHCNIEHTSTEWGGQANFKTFDYSNYINNSRIIALDACTVYSHFVNVGVFDEDGTYIGEHI